MFNKSPEHVGHVRNIYLPISIKAELALFPFTDNPPTQSTVKVDEKRPVSTLQLLLNTSTSTSTKLSINKLGCASVKLLV